ncbi:MAG TPA: hypothetical protein VK144_01310 [Bacillota bacterium]|nr:hypothetical protein [Bacillota bacterium]
MKQPIRYFSIGLIVAGLALFVVYSYFDKPQAKMDEIDVDTLISMVKDNGYHVMEESEYIRLSVIQGNSDEENDDDELDEDKTQDKDTDKEKDEDEDKDKDKDNDKDKDKDKDKGKDKDKDKDKDESTKTTYTIDIQPDMLPSDVSNLLEKEKIIKDASSFNKFLEDNDYSKLIQIGTFKVSSDMSEEEVAKIITRSN